MEGHNRMNLTASQARKLSDAAVTNCDLLFQSINRQVTAAAYKGERQCCIEVGSALQMRTVSKHLETLQYNVDIQSISSLGWQIKIRW